jgi:hypothetical protein
MQFLIAFIGSAFAKVFLDKVLGWVALKVLLVLLFTIFVPIILNNFLYDIIKIMMDFATGSAAGATAIDGHLSFSGFAAWLIEVFRIPEAFSLLVSALVLRLVLSMVPFVRLVG